MSNTPARMALLVALSGCYLGLAASAVSRTTVQYDEFTDLSIAWKLREDPVRGHTWDPSQARLPMYATAVAYRVMHGFDPDLGLLDVLPISRWISLSACVLAIWGTAWLGSRLFDPATGLLGAAFFAFSPYTLHFGSDALTQGDALTPAAVVVALMAFDRFLRSRSALWLAGVALCLGLAIASKFTLVFLIPALIAVQALTETGARRHTAAAREPPARPQDRARFRFRVAAVATGGLALAAAAFSTGSASAQIRWLLPVAALSWLLSLLGLVCSLVLAALADRRGQPRAAGSPTRRGLVQDWLAIVALAMATTLALFPEHTFNPLIIRDLLERLVTRDGGHDLLATAVVSAKLYLGILLFKLGLPFGVATIVALGWAARHAARDHACLLITATLVSYSIVLAILPLQQPFWLMSVYPLILLALAAMIVRALRDRGRPMLWWGTATGVAVAVSWLAVGLTQVYPTFGYYGYETTGDRWLGAESRGYRRLVVVTNDGSTEALDWLEDHAPVDARVVSFLNDVHLLEYLQDTRSLPFELRQALLEPDPSSLAAALASADFAVVRGIDDNDDHPPPRSYPEFVRQFEAEPAHEIVRGRGVYRMPVIRIFRRAAR